MFCRANHVTMKIVDTLKRKKNAFFPSSGSEMAHDISTIIQHINITTIFYFIFYSYNLKWLCCFQDYIMLSY